MKTKLLMSLLFTVCVAQSQTFQVVRVPLNEHIAVSKAIQFFCTPNYDRQGCWNDSLALRQSLVPYPTQQLGTWSFVLVPADDWRTLVRSVGGSPKSPAFSIFDERITVLDQSLFGGWEARNAELMHSFGEIGSSLLDLVVTHELGHVLCLEKDERRANDYGRGLRNRKSVHCSKAPEHATANTSRRYKKWLDSNGSRGESGKYRHYPH